MKRIQLIQYSQNQVSVASNFGQTWDQPKLGVTRNINLYEDKVTLKEHNLCTVQTQLLTKHTHTTILFAVTDYFSLSRDFYAVNWN